MLFLEKACEKPAFDRFVQIDEQAKASGDQLNRRQMRHAQTMPVRAGHAHQMANQATKHDVVRADDRRWSRWLPMRAAEIENALKGRGRILAAAGEAGILPALPGCEQVGMLTARLRQLLAFAGAIRDFT